MHIKISLTILGMIVGIAATGLTTATTTQTADAKINCKNDGSEFACSGGDKLFNQEGGRGEHSTFDVEATEGTSSGGIGAKDFPEGATNGSHCEFNRQTGEEECVGEHLSGN
jgi:hypothetical protein